MQLQIFPLTIADLERRLLVQRRVIQGLKEQIAALDAEIDYTIAFDVELKNDLQRKVRRNLMMASEPYQTLQAQLQQEAAVAGQLEIELSLTQNQFAIAKLEVRERIAKLEAGAA